MKPRQLTWNRFQSQFVLNKHMVKGGTKICGRGTGKSAEIAEVIRTILNRMPRSTWTIQGATYQQLLTRTLPGTFEFLDFLGFKRDVSYWINRKPPVDADYLPYYKPLEYNNYITIQREDGYCVGFVLLSQDSNSRGPSTDGVICDESLLLDQEKFLAETKYTNRGHEKYFSKSNLHHAVFHYTSMPYGDSWLFKHAEYYGDELQDKILLQDEIIDLQYEFMEQTNRSHKLELWSDIVELQKKVNWYVGKNGEFYCEYNVFDNVENLGMRYVNEMFKDSPKHLFLTEALNKRNNKVDGGFYAQLNRKVHCASGFNNSFLENLDMDFSEDNLSKIDSRQDEDCRDDMPMHVGTDYGSAINWLIVAQKHDAIKTLKVVKEFYVKSPKILDHAIMEFCDYYRNHKRKLIILYPDAEGFQGRANHKETYVETTQRILKSQGWTVQLAHRKKYNKLQSDTYQLVNLLLSELREDLWKIRFNPYHCKGLLLSMEQTPAKDYGGRIGKNKDSEKKLKTNREEATDAGDAFDQIIYYLFNDKVGRGRTYLDRTIF